MMYSCRFVLKKVIFSVCWKYVPIFLCQTKILQILFLKWGVFFDLQEIEEDILMKRNEFVEEIGEYDDDIGELVINEKEVKNDDLKNAIRRIVLDSKALITFCGSAYKVRIFWEGHKIFKISPTSDLTD